MVKFLPKLIQAVALLSLISCGGGSGSGGGSGTADSTLTLNGVASIGAPLTEADVLLVSLSSGAVYYATNKTGTDGSFSLTLDPKIYPPPYLLKVSGTSDQQVSVYSYITNDTTKGIVVTPFTSAAVALAAGSDPESAFLNRPNLMGGEFVNKLQVIYKAGQSVFYQFGVNAPLLLAQNNAYVANATGADLALDVLKINYSVDGSVNISTKFASQTLSLNAASTALNTTSLALNSLLANKIVDGINSNNSCLTNAYNNNSVAQFGNCLDVNFKDVGINTASSLLAGFRTYLTNKTLTQPNAASISWCDFDDGTLSFGSSAAAVANKTGVCLAKSKFVASGTTLATNSYYKFTVSATGSDIASVKLFGNQLDNSLSIYPAMEKKIRLDGLTQNTGITSGFKFEIGTKNTSNTVTIYSARVVLKDSTNTALTNGTFYLQCSQGLFCADTMLQICTNSNCTSLSFTDAIVSTNNAVAATIQTAMQTGPVRAEVTAYNKLISDGTKTIVYQKTIPITNLPVSQDIAETLTFPTLSAASVNTLKNWSGGDFSTSFTPGSASAVYGVNFFYPYSNYFKIVSAGQSTASHSGIPGGSTAISSGCAGGSATYRSYDLAGFVLDIPIQTKYFGSCNAGDY
jgi:hypothetical protein